jgi:hypothetical protein
VATPIPPFPGWPPDARALIEQAAARHGGWERWQRLHTVHIQQEELGGPLPWAKGLHRTHPMPRHVEVHPHERRAVFLDYPRAGEAATFAAGDVRITSGDRLLREGQDHRRTFAGLRKYRRWDELDALYFFGYALVTYMSLPFLLGELRFVAACQQEDGGQRLRGVTVEFPAGFHTHCARQRFFFDDTGLLLRHDYRAEVIGAWANAAHYSSDYVAADGLLLARRRRVVATLFGRPTPLPVLHARFAGLAVSYAG